MDCECYVLLGWLVFDALVFIWAWMDDLYYSKDLKSKFSKIKKDLTEELKEEGMRAPDYVKEHSPMRYMSIGLFLLSMLNEKILSGRN